MESGPQKSEDRSQRSEVRAIVTGSAPKQEKRAHKPRQLHASRETSASIGAFHFHS